MARACALRCVVNWVNRGENSRELTASIKSNQEFFVALLIAAWVHVALFFGFVLMLVFDFFSATVIEEDQKPPKNEERVEISLMMLEEDLGEATAIAEEETAQPLPEPLPAEEVAEPEKVEPVPPPSGFVQTNEDQAMESKPEQSDFIGANNTKATSDAGALAGEEKMTALSGQDKVKADIKTYDSNFADGADDGSQKGNQDPGDSGEGEDVMKQEAVEAAEEVVAEKEEMTTRPEREENESDFDESELAEIDQALKELEQALALESMKPPKKKVDENVPEKEEVERMDTAPRDGGFAPQMKKTRVRGVISASGPGSLNVENTPLGRYEATIYKRLERTWQIENNRNRSLIAPGNISLYFAVNPDGTVKNQRQLSMNGASQTQWGMILRALNDIEIPKMPKEVIKELDGDALELTVTFNY